MYIYTNREPLRGSCRVQIYRIQRVDTGTLSPAPAHAFFSGSMFFPPLPLPSKWIPRQRRTLPIRVSRPQFTEVPITREFLTKMGVERNIKGILLNVRSALIITRVVRFFNDRVFRFNCLNIGIVDAKFNCLILYYWE